MRDYLPSIFRVCNLRQLGTGVEVEAAPGFEPGMKVLQTSALPLGYAALFIPLSRFLELPDTTESMFLIGAGNGG